MKTFLGSVLAGVVLTIVVMTSVHADQSAEKEAQKAAESWLLLVDSGKYSESWNEAAQIFKQKVSLQQWKSSLESVRIPLGKLKSRRLKTATYTETLPGVPDRMRYGYSMPGINAGISGKLSF
jgi:sortase (surface protein transpeptidase)